MADQTPSGAIAQRVERLRNNADPQILARMPSGWAILANQQPEAIPGCCMLLPDPVIAHLNDLAEPDRVRFLLDLSRLGDAVATATGAERINYLILCNQVPELHGHVIARYASEDPTLRRRGPFEAYDFASARRADATGPDRDLVARLRAELAPFAASKPTQAPG